MALTKTDLQNIRNAYYTLSKLDPQIKKVEACGTDCSELIRRREAAMKTLKAYNEVYGPEHPESQV